MEDSEERRERERFEESEKNQHTHNVLHENEKKNLFTAKWKWKPIFSSVSLSFSIFSSSTVSCEMRKMNKKKIRRRLSKVFLEFISMKRRKSD